jgi:hypothetical protein
MTDACSADQGGGADRAERALAGRACLSLCVTTAIPLTRAQMLCRSPGPDRPRPGRQTRVKTPGGARCPGEPGPPAQHRWRATEPGSLGARAISSFQSRDIWNVHGERFQQP